jgi:hypothetical protein
MPQPAHPLFGSKRHGYGDTAPYRLALVFRLTALHKPGKEIHRVLWKVYSDPHAGREGAWKENLENDLSWHRVISYWWLNH